MSSGATCGKAANENELYTKIGYRPIGPGGHWECVEKGFSISLGLTSRVSEYSGVSRQTGTWADLQSRSVAASLYEIVSELSSHKNERRAEYNGDMIVRK